jgi:hypothetical protein
VGEKRGEEDGVGLLRKRRLSNGGGGVLGLLSRLRRSRGLGMCRREDTINVYIVFGWHMG